MTTVSATRNPAMRRPKGKVRQLPFVTHGGCVRRAWSLRFRQSAEVVGVEEEVPMLLVKDGFPSQIRAKRAE